MADATGDQFRAIMLENWSPDELAYMPLRAVREMQMDALERQAEVISEFDWWKGLDNEGKHDAT